MSWPKGLVFLVVLWCGACLAQGPPAPKIEVVNVGSGWKTLQIQRTKGTVKAFYGEKGDDLVLKCEAPYPIQWNVTGWVMPPEVVKFQQPKRNLSVGKWELGLNMFFLDAENFTGLNAMAGAACEQVGYWENRDQVAVFVKGRGNKTLHHGGDEGKERVIPCVTSDPSTGAPQLWKGAVMEKADWDALEGFRHHDGTPFSPGKYQCRRGKETLDFEVGEGTFFPEEKLVQRWRDETLEFRCGGNGQKKTVRMIIENMNQVNMSIIKEEDTLKIRSMKVVSPGNDVIKGRTVCVEEGDKVIHEWHYEFLPPPELFLDNVEGEADCLSHVKPKRVESLRCRDSMECQFRGKECLGKSEADVVRACNWKTQKTFHSDYDTHCWIPHKNNGEECASLPYSHLNGLVECGVEGKARRWSFFVGLDYRRYTNWMEAPEKALVRVEEEDGAVVCTAAAFLFADSLAFELEYKNGTVETIYPQADNTAIWELYVKTTLESWPPGVMSATCLAPFWNTTEIIRRRFEGGRRMGAMSVHESEPQMSKVEKRTVAEEEETFYIGAKDQRLNCTNSDQEDGVNDGGNIVWYYQKEGEKEKKMVKDIFPLLEVESGQLLFPEVMKKYEGQYFCHVSTSPPGEEQVISADRILRAYRLNVSAEPMSTSSTVYVGIIILGLVVTGLALAALAVFVQKRHTGI